MTAPPLRPPAPPTTAVAGRFRARAVDVDAVRVVLGTTTKADILALCPSANVGVGGCTENPDSTDLRWAIVATSTGPVPVLDGDWIVALFTGFEVLPDARFRTRFAPLDERNGS